jgi:two-component system sensor histidine kinase KdpD
MRPRARALFSIGASVGAVAAVTVLYFRFVSANPTTVALSYLVTILVISTQRGIVEATAVSILASLCFNVFFLPPVGTFTIAAPQDLVSFFAFTATAIIASQLAGRARQRTIDAVARQGDLERLYALSRALLLAPSGVSIPDVIARHIADTFELSAVALYDHRAGIVSRGGPMELPGIDEKLRDVARQAVPVGDASGAMVTPIRLGGEPIGSLAILGGGLSDTVLQSIANLAAIGLERARGQEIAARAEAARESGELRAAVLDAVAHEFKTPLTSIKAAASDLLSSVPAHARERELVEIVGEESNRLQGLITDAVQMLRIEAGGFAVNRERFSVAKLVTPVLAELSSRLDGHAIIDTVPTDLMVDADGELLRLALRQLLDNAAKYSPPSSTIELTAAGNSSVRISVRNSGSVIPERDQAHVFDRFYRGLPARLVPGTGMGLAIVRQIAQAHGGTVTVASSQESGTVFTLSLPRGGSAS